MICVSMSSPLISQVKEYIYPHYSNPSMSNYGTTGLIMMPSARLYPEGSLVFTWSHLEPYLRGSFVGYPFDWLEASYQYTDVNNKLYSDVPSFSGSQSYKDKSFDAKIRVFKEREFWPAVAVGFRDLGGSSLFASEYVVASKMIGNIDLTLGMGWGVIGNNKVKNPLTYIGDRFRTRSRNTSGDTQGGEVNYETFFSGETASLFGGVEIYLPRMKGTRLKIEYDGNYYGKYSDEVVRGQYVLDKFEGYLPVEQDSRVNFNLLFPVTKNFHVKFGFIRGNELNFGFSIAGLYGGKDPYVKKRDPIKEIENKDAYKYVNSQKNSNLYKTSLRFLGEEGFYLQYANIDDNSNEFHIAYAQNRYMSVPLSIGRISRILDDISPNNIQSFTLTNLNADQQMYTVNIPRTDFKKFDAYKQTNALRESIAIYKTDPKAFRDHEYQPDINFPVIMNKFSPAIRSQIGGPDGFYFGEISIAAHTEIIVRRNINILATSGIGIYDTFQEIKLASDSILPHVRTDIVKYLQQSNKFNITRLQANYFQNPTKDIYTKISGGILEPMFMGVGGEAMWRPFGAPYAIGAEVWRVKQRAFRQLFSTRKYQTTTGHFNFYYREPNTRVLAHIKAGRFLAEDSGLSFNFSREFKSGANMGIFFSFTDISKEEFGEGSFDKGFFFNLPIQMFFEDYSRGMTGFGLRPLTRDGAQPLIHAQDLWSTTYGASINNIMKDWDDVYD
jgi:hypothetical protein